MDRYGGAVWFRCDTCANLFAHDVNRSLTEPCVGVNESHLCNNGENNASAAIRPLNSVGRTR
jgi:hypothetical protein